MERPWLKLYTRDWLDSKELRRCTPTARGILLDLMCLAHEGTPYGYLADKFGPLSVEFLASRCVASIDDLRDAIDELERFKRIEISSPDEVIYIPRMIEDEASRLTKSAAGRKGGNPNLLKQEVKQDGKPEVKQEVKVARARADSDSSSLVLSSEGGLGETLVGECAERMYALHPKKKNLVLVPVALLSAVNGTADVQKFLIEVETCHAAHCETEDWKKCGGRYAPPLDVWIADRGFTKWPEGKSSKVLQEWKPGMPFKPGMTVDPSLIKPWNPFEGLPPTDADSGEKK